MLRKRLDEHELFEADHPFYISLQQKTNDVHYSLFTGSVRKIKETSDNHRNKDPKTQKVI